MMEILLEIGKSKEVLEVTKDSLETIIKSRLPGTSSSGGPHLLPYDCDVPRTKGTYILQKWSSQWDCFVDSNKEVSGGDKLRVVECDCLEVTVTILLVGRLGSYDTSFYFV